MIATEAEARAWLTSLPGFDSAARDRLEMLVAMLQDENRRQNLIAASSFDQIWVRHVVDSAQLIRFVSRETAGVWLDLGTGAGFPGMVIAALQPAREVVMVESRPRRAEWLERAKQALNLSRARVESRRIEMLDSTSVDVISARAFAPLPRLLDLSARFSTAETLWLLPKGRSAAQELQDLRNWQHVFHVEQSLTDPQAGMIVGTLAGRKDKSK